MLRPRDRRCPHRSRSRPSARTKATSSRGPCPEGPRSERSQLLRDLAGGCGAGAASRLDALVVVLATPEALLAVATGVVAALVDGAAGVAGHGGGGLATPAGVGLP